MSNLSPVDGGNFVHDDNRIAHPGSVMKRFSLEGKTAIITGATAGIGRAVAEAYAEAGAIIALWYFSNEKGPESAEEISKKYNVKVNAYQVDIRDAEAVEEVTNQSVKDLNGRLDIFVANAGIPWTKGAMLDAPLEHYRNVMQTDLDGTYYCARAAGKHWRRQKLEGTDLNGKPLTNFSSGSFIATGSMSGTVVNYPQLQSAYNIAKAGVIHLAKCMAIEWARFARANAVSPGYMRTELTDFVPQETKDIWHDKIPQGREGEPHELQGIYLYLASDASTYTTGANFAVDGGYTAP
ncbi:Sorbose reductase sou1 [Fusarium torreyae]|uniref:Sorbose reductase sou1 n=1 Tax=Fusarium torreyae TaxID=1237075 RepID=A0A9W8SB05_9HYPO|nr:Sorbose reductase sou1 [Fusarium torreyae]